MPALRYLFNYSNVILTGGMITGQSIGYYLSCGEVKYARWLGFSDVNQAIAMKGIPVRLAIDQYSDDDLFFNWVDVPESQMVHGCLTADGVYALIQQQLKFVTQMIENSLRLHR